MKTETPQLKTCAPLLSPDEHGRRKRERREKQRQANVGRAVKMHAARLMSEFVQPTLEKLPKINVGCSGWFYWHWREAFYPGSSPTKNWFEYYMRNFPTVELNAPFYSWPTLNTVRTWVRQAEAKHFLYTVKVCELITHVKRFSRTQLLIKDFGLIADLLGAHMGCFLFQLPPSFHYTPARLKIILAQLDSARRNVVEFRHRSWWNLKVYVAFRQAGVIFCSCSAPNLPDELIITADDVYIRFHGLTKWYRHDYSPAELGVWVKRVKESGCKRVWAYFNNDRDAHAIKNAQELTKQLKGSFADCLSKQSNRLGLGR
jgi:uncharacterized protein YecE (DUF72 family)